MAAASDQASELRVAEWPGVETAPAEKDGPSVTFPIAGRLDIPSRRDPQLLEVARVELAAEYYAKAVPVHDAARLSPGQADQQERFRAPAGRGDGLRRQRFRGPDAAAAGGRRRAVHRRVRRGPPASGQPAAGSQVALGARRQPDLRLRVPDRPAQLSGQSRSRSSSGTVCRSRRARRWPSTWSRRRSS